MVEDRRHLTIEITIEQTNPRRELEPPAMPEMFRKSRAFVPRYQKFESTSLQRGVCLCTALQGFRRRAPHFCGSLRRHGDERRDGWLHTRPFWPFFSDGRWGSPTLKARSIPTTRAGRGLCMLNLGLAQLTSSRCCSAQSSGRSSSVSRVAVSTMGCRPCRITSTSCGLKKARSTRRRM